MSELFAGLARRALRPLAIGPRLPSRFETPLAAGAAFTPAGASAPPAADTAGDGPVSNGAAMARDHRAMPSSLSVETQAQHGRTSALDAATPAEHTAAPVTLTADTGGLLPRAAVPEAPAGEARRATPAQAIATATAQLTPLVVTTVTPAPQLQPASAPHDDASPSARHRPEVRPALPLPTGLAPQRFAGLERLDARTHVDGPATPAVTPSVSRAIPPSPPAAAPRVNITIGSIEVVFSADPAPVAAPRAAPAAAPAVQSLDDYLQSRQRRGGPR